jgi:3-deoxy-7-phosphoheptulonate synthase
LKNISKNDNNLNNGEDCIMTMTKSLFSPFDLEDAFPISEDAKKTVEEGIESATDILSGRDDRLLIICGPCSIHDEKSALEYARKLADLRLKVADKFLLVMRVYFEKPRTTIGWKGFIDDPEVIGRSDFEQGIERAWKLLSDINEIGVPVATEFLNPLVVLYT